MRDFINQFGKENLTIIAIVILIILIALVLIVLLEKRKTNKEAKNISNYSEPRYEKNVVEEAIKKPERHINYKPLEALKNIEKMEDTLKYRTMETKVVQNKNLPKREEIHNPYYQKPEPHREFNYNKEIEVGKEETTKMDNLSYTNEKADDVVYKESTITKEEAKEKLEEVTKKLVEEQDTGDHNHFEEEQEEKSIISYEELIKASKDIDEKNDRLLEDEKSAAITLDELYKTNNEDIKIVEKEPVRKERVSSGVANSGVISPVFGRRDMKKASENTKKYREIANSNSDDFLEKLKNFRNKLD